MFQFPSHRHFHYRNPMRKTNHQFEKRQRELEKKRKKDEKRERKRNKNLDTTEDIQSDTPPEAPTNDNTDA